MSSYESEACRQSQQPGAVRSLTERGLLVKARALAVVSILDGRIGFHGRLLLGKSIAEDFAAEVAYLPRGTSEEDLIWPGVFESMSAPEKA